MGRILEFKMANEEQDHPRPRAIVMDAEIAAVIAKATDTVVKVLGGSCVALVIAGVWIGTTVTGTKRDIAVTTAAIERIEEGMNARASSRDAQMLAVNTRVASVESRVSAVEAAIASIDATMNGQQALIVQGFTNITKQLDDIRQDRDKERRVP